MRRRAAALLLLVPLAAAAGSDQLERVDALWFAHETEAAQALVDSLLPLAVAAGDSVLELGLLSRRGQMYAALGRAQEASPALERALDLSRALGDSLMLMANLRWLGVARGFQGRGSEAEGLFEELVATAEAGGNSESMAWGQTGLAYYDRQAGRLASSRERYEDAVARFRALGHVQGELFALNGLGIARVEAGGHDGARAAYERSRELSRSLGLLGGEALALNNLAVLEYELGDPGLAMSLFQAARDLQVRDGNPYEALLVDGNLRLCLIALGRPKEARALVETQLARCRELGFPDLEVGALQQLAALLNDSGESARAESLVTALRQRENLTIKDRFEALILHSRIRARRDGQDAARALLRSEQDWALALEDPALRARFALELGRCELECGSPAAALPRLEVAGEAADPGIRLEAAILAARAEQAQDRPAAARTRLLAAAELWEAERSLPRDPDWREVRGAAGAALFPEMAGLILASGDEGATAAAFAQLQLYKTRTLLERLGGPGSVPRPPPAVGLDRLQAEVLREGELLLDFSIGPTRSLLIAVTRRQARAAMLPPGPELAPPLDALAAQLAAPARAVDSLALAEQGALLLGEVSDLIAAARHVIVVADGPLQSLPLAALLPAGGPSLSRAPSAALLAELRSRRAVVGTTAPRLYARGDDLPGAWRELRRLERSYRGFERLTLSATTTGDAGFTHAGLLHFAAHARADDEHPWRSAVLGAGDFQLEARAIAGRHLEAGLVVLAACESAAGRGLPGEGLQGLASAFLVAGAPAVLATLWPVDDAVSADLALAFYRELAAGRTAAAALARAQAMLRARPATRHPAYWAGFVLIGDGEARVDLDRRGGFASRRAILAYVLAGLGLWLLLGRLVTRRNSS